jgi:RNA polymerase sigma-70 factor (family 1)
MKIETGNDLITLINKGHTNAFAKFYTSYFQKLLLASDNYVKDVFVAEEIVQDTFLKVWENPDSLQSIKSVKSYLYKSVINSSINYINRKKNIEQHHVKIADELTEEALSDLDDEQELIVILNREIEKLPTQCRKVFKLSRFDGFKYKEIAGLLGISEKTVENHISNALKVLRGAMLNQKIAKKSGKGYQFLIGWFFF